MEVNGRPHLDYPWSRQVSRILSKIVWIVDVTMFHLSSELYANQLGSFCIIEESSYLA